MRSGGAHLSLMWLTGACLGGESSLREKGSPDVPVVSSTTPVWSPAETWRVGAAVVSIGSAAGEGEVALYRVTDAMRLGSGAVVIANGGTDELLWIDSEGHLLRRVGRRGSGPGEFTDLSWVAPWPGDSVAAYDWAQFRLALFDRDGVFGRSLRFGPYEEVAAVIVRGVFSDATFFATAPVGGERPVEGTTTAREVLYHLDPDGGMSADSIGWAELQTMVTVRMDDSRTLSEWTRFSPSTWYGFHEDLLYVGRGDTYDVHVLENTGRLVRVIRRNTPRVAVTAALRRHVREEEDSLIGGRADPALRRRLADANPFPDSLPAFGITAYRSSTSSAIELDPDGNLWVHDYPVPGEPGANWSVFGPAGVWFGTVKLPVDLEVFEIGADYILGAWRDELGVEFIRVYPLIKRP